MGLNLVVCIKSVIMKPPEADIVRSEDLLQLNPYDRPAVEAALRLREVRGGTVTILSMGPEAGNAALAETLAMGADRGILLCDPLFKGSDTLATSTILSAGIRRLAPLIWYCSARGPPTAIRDRWGPRPLLRWAFPS